MSNDIDNMLKYYMVQLNEKLDDSYHSIEDSTLSHINITSSLNNIDLSKFENQNLKNKKVDNINNNTNNITNATSSNNSIVNTMIGKKPNKLPVIKKNNDNNNTNINK